FGGVLVHDVERLGERHGVAEEPVQLAVDARAHLGTELKPYEPRLERACHVRAFRFAGRGAGARRSQFESYGQKGILAIADQPSSNMENTLAERAGSRSRSSPILSSSSRGSRTPLHIRTKACSSMVIPSRFSSQWRTASGFLSAFTRSR